MQKSCGNLLLLFQTAQGTISVMPSTAARSKRNWGGGLYTISHWESEKLSLGIWNIRIGYIKGKKRYVEVSEDRLCYSSAAEIEPLSKKDACQPERETAAAVGL